jgi:predicted O-methyltransferase YrrM
MFNGTINEVLFEIAKQIGLQWNELVQYANEAPYAAGRPDGIPWPSGTGSVSEKRILYAITRALNPVLCLDLGTRWGAMALQIATGIRDTSDTHGHLTSIDNETHIHGSRQPVGKFIPPHIKRIRLINADAVKYLGGDKFPYTLIFEDTEHTFEMTKAIYELAPERLKPGGVIISHDACHPKFKGAVVKGIKATGIEPIVYLVEGDSCGLAIWQKPKRELVFKEKPEVVVTDVAINEITIDTETPQEKPQRRKRKRKKASAKVEKAIDESVTVEVIGQDDKHIYLKETPTPPEAL